MITRTFLNKSNTIKKGSNENYGIHPIVMFNSGLEETRVLIDFDIDNIIDKMIEFWNKTHK